ncbi:hypothetical protein RMATCC62417_00555 [Rhizopus microsporus]|nr:hypothetical protein RMATCC62417_00555 [Rhizopus microsporus]
MPPSVRGRKPTVQSFINTIQARIQDKTFMPLKYTDPRGSRYFSLLPLYKIDSKSIQIDGQAFWRLAKQCNNKIKLGYKTLESLTSRSKKFTNVITTNGYAVSFMFKKIVSIQDEPRRELKTPKDFVDIVDDAEIWAVDPGISTIFTAVDSTEHERVRTTSLEEYYHLCGEFKYINELPTLKTANFTSFLLAASIRLQNYQRIHNYYCQDKWSQKLKFKTYINKQKETQEIVKRLFDNSKKHGKTSTAGAKNQNPNKSKHVPLSPADLPSSSQRKRIIAFGDGTFCSSMKGKRAAPTKRITEEINRKCKQSDGGSEFVYADKYLTSQICNKCKMKEMNNFSVSESKRRVHSVLKCGSCGTVWNRDANNALNIYNIFV